MDSNEIPIISPDTTQISSDFFEDTLNETVTASIDTSHNNFDGITGAKEIFNGIAPTSNTICQDNNNKKSIDINSILIGEITVEAEKIDAAAPTIKIIDNSLLDIENNPASANKCDGVEDKSIFNKAFTFPTKYLPKNKQLKIETSDKPKKAKSRDMDAWYEYHMEKERMQQIKQEKLEKNKKLQEKKKLLEKKKQLAEQMKQIQQKIKKETKEFKSEVENCFIHLFISCF